MTCPECGGKTYVKDCRSQGDVKWRRRECEECKHRFNTFEIDADYYATLTPTDKNAMRLAVQCALLDGFTDMTNHIYKALNIKERVNEDESET